MTLKYNGLSVDIKQRNNLYSVRLSGNNRVIGTVRHTQTGTYRAMPTTAKFGSYSSIAFDSLDDAIRSLVNMATSR